MILQYIRLQMLTLDIKYNNSIVLNVKIMITETVLSLEAFSVDNGRTCLIVLRLRDPHLLEGGQ